ncbi:MAG: FtsX-like permease family protein [Bryobacteraceae bacterium]
MLKRLLVPFIETTVGPVRPLLRLLMGAVCLALVLVCANLASLLIARAAERVHEIGVRIALGAERLPLIQLLLTESMMLSVIGGALAIPVTYAALNAIVKLNPGDIPRFEETRLDSGVLLFGLLASLATGLLAGIFPAYSASSVSVCELLRTGGRGIVGTSIRARNILIVAEVSLAVVLLAGAGLLIRSYLAVQQEDKGFAKSTLTLSIELDAAAQNSDVLRRQVMDRIRSLPGVQVAGSIDDLPLSTYEDKGFLEVEGYHSTLRETASVRETAGDYFRAMQIPLIAGRYLTESDIAKEPGGWPATAAVSESFAKRYFARHSAIGHRLRINGSHWSIIIGVVGDVRHSGLETAPEPTIYIQNGLADSVAIRTSISSSVLISSIRRAVNAIGPGIVITDVRTMSQYVDQASAARRFQTVLLTCFAGVALLLALIGLFGLLGFSVQRRTAEIGIRMAIGASRRVVMKMVVVYALKLASAGIVIGIPVALLLTRMMASLLYGVRAADPITFVAVPCLILVVAAIACAIPAWKAASVDPANALRA